MPHVVDTLLLSTGIYLAWAAGFSPVSSNWLLFKLMALLVYIVMGYLAMKKSGLLQWSTYLLATSAVLFILMAATTKQPWPWS